MLSETAKMNITGMADRSLMVIIESLADVEFDDATDKAAADELVRAALTELRSRKPDTCGCDHIHPAGAVMCYICDLPLAGDLHVH